MDKRIIPDETYEKFQQGVEELLHNLEIDSLTGFEPQLISKMFMGSLGYIEQMYFYGKERDYRIEQREKYASAYKAN